MGPWATITAEIRMRRSIIQMPGEKPTSIELKFSSRELIFSIMAVASPPAATPSLSSSYLPKLEASFCRDFMCCGTHHKTLHDLLTHFESHPPSPPPTQDFAYRNPVNEAVSTSDVFGEVEMGDMRMDAPDFGEEFGMDYDTMETIEDPGRRLFVGGIGREEKPFKCRVIGCDKAYKNQNGLKYHKMHGHTNQTLAPNLDGSLSVVNSAATSPVPSVHSSPSIAHAAPMMPQGGPQMAGGGGNAAVVGGFVTATACGGDRPEKPYGCQTCGKRYKNLNGLKYHRMHSTH